MSLNVKKVLRIVKPLVKIGGIEIRDNSLLYFVINPETFKATAYSVSVPRGVLQYGVIKDKNLFIKSLIKLHSQISKKDNEKIPVILSVSDYNVYTQVFSLPTIEGEEIDENTVFLNMQMVSPLDLSDAYYDWEKINGNVNDNIKIVASFIKKRIVDSFIDAFSQANFNVIAIEQKAESLARFLFEESNYQKNINNFNVVLHIESDGLSFSIVKGRFIYFNRFLSWNDIKNDKIDSNVQISLSDFKNVIVNETQKILNYYSSHYESSVNSIVLLCPGLESNVVNILKNNFKLNIILLESKHFKINNEWYIAIGSALRGVKSRSSDNQISLTPEGTEIEFKHAQIIVFMKLWKNIIASTAFVIILSMLFSFLFLQNYAKNITKDLYNMPVGQNTKALNLLKEKAKEFNNNISIALKAKNSKSKLSEIVSSIYNASGNVIINRLYIESYSSPIIINAQAVSENDAVNFKTRLEKIKYIKSIDFPLSAITQYGDNLVKFQIILKLKNNI